MRRPASQGRDPVRQRTYVRFMHREARLTAAAEAPALVWLAGLLEAEGTFLKPPPSSPRLPIVACRMTDRDVVERVAGLLGRGVCANGKGRYRIEFATTIKGSTAVRLMTDMRPLMGTRRSQAIDTAIAAYVPPAHKLTFSMATEIRRRHATGESVSELARSHDVARSTIRPLLAGRIYREPASAPWRKPADWLPTTLAPPPGIAISDLLWLAGWLEGEGSFCAPPPSNPRRPRISGTCCDLDVITEVGRILGTAPTRVDIRRAHFHGWSPTWRILQAGLSAMLVMEAIRPLMGRRRTAQIGRALTRARKAQRLPGPHRAYWQKMEAGGFAPPSADPKRKASTGLAGS